MFKNVNKKQNPFVASFVLLGLGLLGLISGFFGRASDPLDINEAFDYGVGKGNSYEGEIKYCSQVACEYSHRLYYIIPLGTEYYYVAFSEDQSEAVVVRADKKFGDNFDEDTGEAISTVHVKGRVDSMARDVENHFADIKKEINLDTPNFDSYYIDLIGDSVSIFRIISGIGLLVSDIFLTLFFIRVKSKIKEGDNPFNYNKMDKVLLAVGAIILIPSMLLFIYSLLFW